MNYRRETYSAERLYKLSPTVINKGFERKGLGKYTREQRLEYIDKNLLGNDKNYGKHCYGGNGEYKDNDYRGRGFIHLTHFSTYQACHNYTGLNILKYPELLEKDYLAAIESALWFWNIHNKIGGMADKDNMSISDDKVMRSLTKVVNTALDGHVNRVKYRDSIKKYFFDMFGECK
ncbi:hypothetical protein BKL50_10345 [Rodentibacter pneumotropicus]|nr:hypothetical protein BKL50_10345 [Rodentibacter pneumotropicus]